MDLADANGWYICVLGATAPWLPIYRAAGLSEVYIGDEAIVDCQTFSLKGKSMKSLRGAYNRVSKSGYHVAIMPSLEADEHLRQQLEDLATETRQGEVERGFSMTLSRMFDERDPGSLAGRLSGSRREARGLQPVCPGQPYHRILPRCHAPYQ